MSLMQDQMEMKMTTTRPDAEAVSHTDSTSEGPRKQELLLDRVHYDNHLQLRVGTSATTVDDYADKMQRGVELPPPVVFQDGSQYLLADGFHTFAALHKCGRKEGLFDVRTGSRRDALTYALGANDEHGLRLTNEDKRKKVTTALRDETWRGWSDAKLAELCRVSDRFVASVRREMGIEVTTRVGRDGRRTDTSRAGKRGTSAPPAAASRAQPAAAAPTPASASARITTSKGTAKPSQQHSTFRETTPTSSEAVPSARSTERASPVTPNSSDSLSPTVSSRQPTVAESVTAPGPTVSSATTKAAVRPPSTPNGSESSDPRRKKSSEEASLKPGGSTSPQGDRAAKTSQTHPALRVYAQYNALSKPHQALVRSFLAPGGWKKARALAGKK